MKKGFTLAEVLITLGIIGVVAALTLPALIANHRRSVVETRLAKFYSIINQAIIASEIENGDKIYWDQLSSDNGQAIDDEGKPVAMAWYNKYLAKYIDTLKVEEDNNYEGKIKVYFKDGSLVLISGSSWIFYPKAHDYEKLVNSNDQTDRKREDAGIKYFTFLFYPWNKNNKYHYGKGLEPYLTKWDGTEETLRNHNSYGCKESVSNERAYCTALIQMNGWKIPKDYPLRL